jgi:hypothetical protein
MNGVKTAKRVVGGAVIIGVAAAVAVGGYLARQQHTPATIPEMPLADGVLLTNWWEIPNPIFRLPLDAQESLLLQMEYVYDTQADASPSMHGDERKRFRPSGLLQYGVGAEAQRIEQWLNKPLFGDAAHALLIEEKYGFGRPLFSFSIEEVGAELQEGAVPESLRALFQAHGESLSEQASLIDAESEWWISDGILYILRQEEGIFRVYGEPRKGNPRLVEQRIPVDWTPRSFRVLLPAGTRPKWCQVMRVRKTPTSSGTEQTQQVEAAYLDWHPKEGWQTRKAASFTHNAGKGLSALQFWFDELTEITPDMDWVAVAWFSADAPRGEQPYEQFLIVAVLSGQIVSRDGTLVLNAGEAACVGLVHPPNEPFAQVERMRPVELRVYPSHCVLRWDAFLTGGRELLDIALYALPRGAKGARFRWDYRRDGIDLDLGWSWAPQRAVWLVDF